MQNDASASVQKAPADNSATRSNSKGVQAAAKRTSQLAEMDDDDATNETGPSE